MAGQYGRSTGQRRPAFGRVDPFCLFAVVPMLLLAGLMFWGNLVLVGVIIIVCAALLILIDSWFNRPPKTSRPEYYDDEDDYESRGRY
ncbi:hypothetical protein ABZ816_19185 [Actinosynnema sp. NPDC047251]|uniref:Uncharacterized protein n=1 Tax=Saccharothrix espanaensis (strain ATCC 51144 / DSM 44229 / JCM 9112 / NBRC 15066 / NRRL 15764) TaxID=1179773 RepID=K0K4J9_SACES|nr:hypothetical protein [Saccharothrix espanaensis]CCH33216.1 hypothetical protein BN6_59600 [Saccharothrix espanaensis DSM 44229]